MVIGCEVGALKRELAKGAVAQRALEREVARVRSHAESLDRTKFEYLEEKLRAKEQQLLAVRKERNALLGSLRQLQQQPLEQPSQQPQPRHVQDADELPPPEAVEPEQQPPLEPEPQPVPEPTPPSPPRRQPHAPAPRTPADRLQAVESDDGTLDDAARRRATKITPHLLDDLEALSRRLLA